MRCVNCAPRRRTSRSECDDDEGCAEGRPIFNRSPLHFPPFFFVRFLVGSVCWSAHFGCSICRVCWPRPWLFVMRSSEMVARCWCTARMGGIVRRRSSPRLSSVSIRTIARSRASGCWWSASGLASGTSLPIGAGTVRARTKPTSAVQCFCSGSIVSTRSIGSFRAALSLTWATW